MTTTVPTQETSPFLQRVMRNTKASSAVLAILAAVCTGVGIWRWLAAGDKTPDWPLIVWCFALAFCLLCGAVWLLIYEPRDDTYNAVASRTFILTVGGLVGLVTAVLGLYLIYHWWADILMWTEMGGPDPARVERAKRVEAAWHVLGLLVALIGGLAIMLFSLQAARADIRTSPVLRQILFGYNAFLTGLLLLMILVVANVWIGAKFPKPLDFTATGMYTLSSRAENILRNLDRPVKVYVWIVPEDEGGEIVQSQMKTMLTNAQEISDKISSVEVNRFEDEDKLLELQKKMGKSLEPGLILEYDIGSDKKEKKYQQIRQDELSSRDSSNMSPMNRGERTPIQFKGEDALMSALSFMIEGKKTVVYVTQGHGELDLRESRGAGMGMLTERLEKRNFEVKPLKLGADPVPADADVVIVAGPKQTLPAPAVKALEDYMNKKGRMFIMADLVLGLGRTPQPTGLEGILGKYGVDLVSERLFGVDVSRRPPRFLPVIVAAGDDKSQNPVAAQFSDPTRAIILAEARPVRTAPNPMGMGRTSAQTLLVQNPRVNIAMFAEPNLSLSPQQIVEQFEDLRDLQRRLDAASKMTLAVYATEGGMTPPPHPGLPPQPSGDQKPKLVVVGASSLASNELVHPRMGTVNADFVASSLDWLADTKVQGGLPAKTVAIFTLPPEAKNSVLQLVMLPSLMIMIGIIGTGTGVWLVRRR
jgi:hypothetical protein